MRTSRISVYTSGEAATLLQCSPRTVNNLFDAGKIAGYKINRDRRIPHRALLEYMERTGVPVPAALNRSDNL